MILRMPKPQTFESHTSRDPVYLFALGPLLLISLISAIVYACKAWPVDRPLYFAWILLTVILFLMAAKLRSYSLKVQDRVIRLEEHLRLKRLAPGMDADAFSVRQLIALRFASDAELPSLAAKALAENLDPKAIKAAIASWRPDYARI